MAFLDETGLAELWALTREADVKIATGTYSGWATGNYGDTNHGSTCPNTLAFDFDPVLVFVFDPTRFDLPKVFFKHNTYAPFTNSTATGADLVITWGNQTISWYVASLYDNSYDQLNQSGVTYKYFAIG